MTTTVRYVDEVEGGLGRGTRLLLVGAPLLMALGRALLVPLDDEDWGGVMSRMAANQSRSDAGWTLAIVASGLLAVTAVVLANRLRAAGKARTAMFVTVTTAIGWASTAATCLTGLYLSVAATATDRGAQVALFDKFNDEVSVGFVFVMALVAAVGYITLAVGLARASAVTKGAAVLLGIGGAATLLTMGGPITALLVLAALLLAAGHFLATRADVAPA